MPRSSSLNEKSGYPRSEPVVSAKVQLLLKRHFLRFEAERMDSRDQVSLTRPPSIELTLGKCKHEYYLAKVSGAIRVIGESEVYL